MAFESLNDQKISELLACPKLLTNPNARAKMQDGSEQYNYKVKAIDESGHMFEIYKRQNKRPGMEDSFSCGISWIAPNGETITLKRYNGPNHNHRNRIEGINIGSVCHIHLTTARYINANLKSEGFATASDKYNTLEGALHCLVKDCNVSGIVTNADQAKLF